MSPELISRSPDLGKLVDDGYEVEVVSGHIVLHRVPYVNANCEVRFGQLIAPVEVVDSRLAPPQDHTVYFAGEYPCKANGDPIEAIRNASSRFELATGLHADHQFSAKPQPHGVYRDFHQKMTTYANIIGSHAKRVDASVTAQPGRLVVSHDSKDPSVSLTPSVGNWAFHCRSHYWICRNEVRWARPFGDLEIEQVRRTNRSRRNRYFGRSPHVDSPSVDTTERVPLFKRLYRRAVKLLK